MKVLVQFEQEFCSVLQDGLCRVEATEKITKVFYASSAGGLLARIEDHCEVPLHLKRLFPGRELFAGEKRLLWYLPETLEPHI